MTVRVQKWGNSLGVRIPHAIARQSAIRQGSELDVSIHGGRVLLKPVKTPSLKQLLSEMKAENRPELIAWGGPVGREVW